MNDPHPENITGEKRHSFSWNVEVDVGQLVLGLAAIFALWKFGQLLDASDDGENDEVTGGYTGD